MLILIIMNIRYDNLFQDCKFNFQSANAVKACETVLHEIRCCWLTCCFSLKMNRGILLKIILVIILVFLTVEKGKTYSFFHIKCRAGCFLRFLIPSYKTVPFLSLSK